MEHKLPSRVPSQLRRTTDDNEGDKLNINVEGGERVQRRLQAAKVLGEDKAAEKYGSHALEVKAAFQRTFVKPQGTIQASAAASHTCNIRLTTRIGAPPALYMDYGSIACNVHVAKLTGGWQGFALSGLGLGMDWASFRAYGR